MKKAMTAGLVIAGIIALSGTSFAENKTGRIIRDSGVKVAKTQTGRQRPPEPPEGFDRMNRPMSRDKRPPLPPDGRHPRISGDKRPPFPPRSGDRRPPEHRMNRTSQQGVQPRN